MDHVGARIATRPIWGPTGSKCQKFDSQAQDEGDQALLESQASSIALSNDTVVSEEHARLVAQQVDIYPVNNCQDIPVQVIKELVLDSN